MTDLITVTVFEDDNIEHKIPELASEFMEFWRTKIDMVPEEFKGSAYIEIESTEEWGSAGISAKVTYTRPKTDEDRARDKQDYDLARNLQEGRERRTLAELLAKYPSHGDAWYD